MIRFFARRRARRDRAAALAAYEDACQRGDTRAMHTLWDRLRAATAECLRVGA